MLAVQLGQWQIADHLVGWFFTGSVLCGIIGYFLAGTKGNSCWGCSLGCLFGPFGILLAMLIPGQRYR